MCSCDGNICPLCTNQTGLCLSSVTHECSDESSAFQLSWELLWHSDLIQFLLTPVESDIHSERKSHPDPFPSWGFPYVHLWSRHRHSFTFDSLSWQFAYSMYKLSFQCSVYHINDIALFKLYLSQLGILWYLINTHTVIHLIHGSI